MKRLYPAATWAGALCNTGTLSKPRPDLVERQRRLRRGYAVAFYSGRNGTGKSLCAVFDTMPDLDMGRTVLSTVRLLDYSNPRPCEGWWGRSEQDAHDCPVCATPGAGEHQQAHPAYVPFTDWPQLLKLDGSANPAGVEGAICVMDEVTGVADSSDSNGLPNMVANELAQLRRAKVIMRVTGLNFIRAHKRIREATLAVTRCESFLPVDVEGQEVLWRPRRLAVWRTYDAKTLPIDDIKESHWDEADLIVKSRHWIPDSPAIAAYDTLAPVDRVGTVSDAGRCAYCGGSRKVHECCCDDYQQEKVARAAARPARRAAPRTRAATDNGTLAVAQ